MTKFNVFDLTDEDLDQLADRMSERASARENEQREAARRDQEERDAAKHCSKCGSYMSCRERRDGKCDSCWLNRR